jgi:hypothetical protein
MIRRVLGRTTSRSAIVAFGSTGRLRSGIAGGQLRRPTIPTIIDSFCLAANVSETRAGALTGRDEDLDECVSGAFVVS